LSYHAVYGELHSITTLFTVAASKGNNGGEIKKKEKNSHSPACPIQGGHGGGLGLGIRIRKGTRIVRILIQSKKMIITVTLT
jgi:hypothetical protein